MATIAYYRFANKDRASTGRGGVGAGSWCGGGSARTGIPRAFAQDVKGIGAEGGIRTHELLREGITYSVDLESLSVDRASIPLQ